MKGKPGRLNWLLVAYIICSKNTELHDEMIQALLDLYIFDISNDKAGSVL